MARAQRLCFAAAPALLVAAAAMALKPVEVRDKIPEVKVWQPATDPVALSSRLSQHPALLLLKVGPVHAVDCQALLKVSQALDQANLSLYVYVPKAPPNCMPESIFTMDSAGAAVLPSLDEGSWRTVIVDTGGIVRLIRAVPADHNWSKSVQQLAADWDGGRQLFSLHCGHCHGDDGSDTSYTNVKTMSGISTRMKPEQILEGGQTFGAVDVSSWSASMRQAILFYIEGL